MTDPIWESRGAQVLHVFERHEKNCHAIVSVCGLFWATELPVSGEAGVRCKNCEKVLGSGYVPQPVSKFPPPVPSDFVESLPLPEKPKRKVTKCDRLLLEVAAQAAAHGMIIHRPGS